MSSLGSGQRANDTQSNDNSDDKPAADRNDRIREIAYFLWLEEGSPDGGEERHWLAAEAAVGSEGEDAPLDANSAKRKLIEGEPPGEPVRATPGARTGPKRLGS